MRTRFHRPPAENDKQAGEFEVCVLCGKLTNVPRTRPVELRSGYIPGAGQLCCDCMAENIQENRAAMRRGYVYSFPEQPRGR